MPRALLILLASLLLARPSVAAESVPTTLELFHSVKETDFFELIGRNQDIFRVTPTPETPPTPPKPTGKTSGTKTPRSLPDTGA